MTPLRHLTETLRRTTGRATPASDSQPLRVDADATVRVQLTVNGRAAEVDVAPRVTLADALRDHLGLTGTHLGCEHGVCGMCTVTVDGEAARACLLLACQLDGAEIMTVEGLGRPDDLHPLQESFGRHHALQCGFCTPGMLMSAYDLLDHEPGVRAEDLPEKMSGVLCRCTGYRHIIDAVADVADTHPDAVPPPRNCGRQALLPRTTLGGPGAAAEDGPSAVAAAREISLPQSEPTVRIALEHEVSAPPGEVWDVMNDTERLAACLPGAELLADHGDDRYAGRIRVALGPIKLAFLGDIHVTERDAEHRSLRAVAQAADAGGGTVQADVRLAARTRPDGAPGSVIHAEADLFMVGRIAQFGRSLAGDVSTDMFAQFAAALDAAARGDEPAVAAAPPSAVAMLTRLVSSRARALRDRLARR